MKNIFTDEDGKSRRVSVSTAHPYGVKKCEDSPFHRAHSIVNISSVMVDPCPWNLMSPSVMVAKHRWVREQRREEDRYVDATFASRKRNYVCLTDIHSAMRKFNIRHWVHLRSHVRSVCVLSGSLVQLHCLADSTHATCVFIHDIWGFVFPM